MKDRIKRNNRRKPSHRLFRTMLSVSFVTAISTVIFSLLLVNINKENKTLNQKIENYTIQIDMLENNDSENKTLQLQTNP
jgi:cell division protein FtsX